MLSNCSGLSLVVIIIMVKHLSWKVSSEFKLVLCFLTSDVSDINECSQGNGGCVQLCVNAVGTYACSCREGYTLNVDERTCDGEMLAKAFLFR